MKIYTRSGDAGETGLYGGQRVGKDDLRVETYGTVDELNACLGVVLALPVPTEARAMLLRVQGELFVLGADLATPQERGETVPRTHAALTAQLEAEIDRMEADLPPLQRFILPGGSPAGSALHLARTLCRRAERRLVSLMRLAPINPEAETYLNRLSDYLFVMARWVNHAAQVPEAEWSRPA